MFFLTAQNLKPMPTSINLFGSQGKGMTGLMKVWEKLFQITFHYLQEKKNLFPRKLPVIFLNLIGKFQKLGFLLLVVPVIDSRK